MSATVSSEERSAFYHAAHLGLRALDAAERTPRRFGSDADARWRSFQGHLGLSDRLNLLIRDAAVTWASGFSPAIVFGLPGLASDEPFGPDWTALPEHEAKRLWSDSSRPTVAALFEFLGVPTSDVDLPKISAATQLIVAGGAATRSVASHFATNTDLSRSDQVLVVASSPMVRQCAGLVAALLQAQGPTRLVHPANDVRSSLKELGISGGGHAVVSNDAPAEERSFAREATQRN